MRVAFISLGCDKNKVDSEKIFKFFLDKTNAKVTYNVEDADIAILNTCSFIRDAKMESIEWINYLTKLKKNGKLKKIIVTGCLATEITKYDNLQDSGLDLDNIDCILPLDKYLKGLMCVNDRVNDILSFSSFLKICDGCDKFCSYCIIPYLRGRFKSAKSIDLITEAKKLAKKGVKELNIVGQDILNYGVDLDEFKKQKKEKPIVSLLKKISKIHGIEWIRLLYCYPEEIDDSIIDMIKDNKKILPYIDMPIQHASDRILKSMNRHTTKAHIKEIVEKLKDKIPNICIRTTILVGFPGETDKDFEELKSFVKEMQFDKLGVFTYSREKLSKSYGFPNQVDEKKKNKRKAELLNIQKDIVKKKNNEKIGLVYTSLVEGFDSKRKSYVVRPYFNARNIDDKVYVKTKENLMSGEFINVEITKSLGYDLKGRII